MLDFKTFTYNLSKEVGDWTILLWLVFPPARRFSLPGPAKVAIAVSQEELPTMGKPCYGFSYQTSSGSEINGQPCDVCAGSASQFVSSRDSFPGPPDLHLSAVKFWMLIQCLICGTTT